MFKSPPHSTFSSNILYIDHNRNTLTALFQVNTSQTHLSQDSGTLFPINTESCTSIVKMSMQHERWFPCPGMTNKFAYVVDPLSDAVTSWSPDTGLTAPDTTTAPGSVAELMKSTQDYFCQPKTHTVWVPVFLWSKVDIEALKQRGDKNILVLEIDGEKMMPDGQIYPVRDMFSTRQDVWQGDAKGEWMSTYLILHRVPREAITVYTVEELEEKGEFRLCSSLISMLSGVQSVKNDVRGIRLHGQRRIYNLKLVREHKVVL